MAGVTALWSAPMLVMLLVVPKFDAIFQDFGVRLPWRTQWIIDASRWLLGNQPGQAVPGLVFAAPAFLIALGAALVLVMRERSWITLIGLLLLPLLAIGAIAAAMFPPLLAMIESLQGGGP